MTGVHGHRFFAGGCLGGSQQDKLPPIGSHQVEGGGRDVDTLLQHGEHGSTDAVAVQGGKQILDFDEGAG